MHLHQKKNDKKDPVPGRLPEDDFHPVKKQFRP